MDLRDLWSRYESAWGETNAGRRTAIFGETLDGKFVYSDPLTRTEGHDQLSAYVGQLQSSFPGMRIVTTSFEQHHDACLVKWAMEDNHRSVVAQGVTCGEVNEAGLLRKASVFYDLPR